MNLLLASGSIHRARLLRTFGFVFEQRRVDLEERLRTKDSPQENAQRLAREKGECALQRWSQYVVLAADTIVVDAHGKMLNKPRSRAEAAQSLALRSGRFEQAVTGFCIMDGNKPVVNDACTTMIRYQVIPPAAQQALLDREEWRGVCGGLRIEQGIRDYVLSVEGDYHNIMGLPMQQLVPYLAKFSIFPTNS